MEYISLFSGIEAVSCAWEPLGMKPVVFAEIDPACNKVLKAHYPSVPNVGDVRDIDWLDYGGIDCIVGGSPCQSFSREGKREGFDGESGLVREFVRAVQEAMPRWFVWENVPGTLTIEEGGAFKWLLEQMDKLGYGLAWRVLDARFFGVPHERRRLFLVGSLGTMRCTEVLFDTEGLCRPVTPNNEQWLLLTRGRDADFDCWAKASDGGKTGVTLNYTRTIGRKGTGVALFYNGVTRWCTPTEIERLFGFPDGWTDVGLSDDKRKKILGNSMVVPVMRYIGERILASDKFYRRQYACNTRTIGSTKGVAFGR